MILETERLVLRRSEAADADAVAAIWADPEVTRFMGGPRDLEQTRRLVEENVGKEEAYTLWPLVEKESGAVVGDCGLLEKEVDGQPEIEVIYVLARGAWGRGYATEAARALIEHAFGLGHARIVALIVPDNAASVRVAEKAGMVHERDTVRPNGRTMRVYAIHSSS